MYIGFIGFRINFSAGLFVDTFQFDDRREISYVQFSVRPPLHGDNLALLKVIATSTELNSKY